MNIVLDEEPRTLILRFILAPDDVCCVGVFFQFGGKCLVGERIELLDTKYRDFIAFLLSAFLYQVVIHLARASDDPLDLVGIFDDIGILLRNHRLERTLGELS